MNILIFLALLLLIAMAHNIRSNPMHGLHSGLNQPRERHAPAHINQGDKPMAQENNTGLPVVSATDRPF
jgi:hypothetical protein